MQAPHQVSEGRTTSFLNFGSKRDFLTRVVQGQPGCFTNYNVVRLGAVSGMDLGSGQSGCLFGRRCRQGLICDLNVCQQPRSTVIGEWGQVRCAGVARHPEPGDTGVWSSQGPLDHKFERTRQGFRLQVPLLGVPDHFKLCGPRCFRFNLKLLNSSQGSKLPVSRTFVLSVHPTRVAPSGFSKPT